MKFLYILGLLILIPLASAESTIVNAYFPDSKIIINTTNNITNFSTPPDAPENTLQIYINNSRIQLNASINSTISNISFLNDKWYFNANGSSFLNVITYFTYPLNTYSLFNDSVKISDNLTNSTNNLTLNITLEDQHLYEIYDVTPPNSITNLSCSLNALLPNVAIDCSWTNPENSDFNYTNIYINSNFRINLTTPNQAVTITGLTPNAPYTFSTHTVDYAGNLNTTWVNASITTQATSYTQFRTTCASVANTYITAIQLFSVALMILAFGFVFMQIKGVQTGEKQISPHAIFLGIMVGIIGFGMLLTGNYLIYAIMEVTQC